MTKTTKALIAGAAIAGLFSGSTARAYTSVSKSEVKAGKTVQTMDQDKASCKGKNGCKGVHDCKGKNACKGQGGCKSGDNGCKGKNSCKGKGGCATKAEK